MTPLLKMPEWLRASSLHASISGGLFCGEDEVCLVMGFVFNSYLLFLRTDIPILVLGICYPSLGF
jgi:hypothetical protein